MNEVDLRDLVPDNSNIGPHGFTKTVHRWVAGFGKDDIAFAEVIEIARSSSHIEIIADFVKTWFVQRLTVDPGVKGPFHGLSSELLSDVLDNVRWLSIVQSIREL
jgi:hypothetical protein